MGIEFDLIIGEMLMNFIGKICIVIIVNGFVLVLLLCWWEGIMVNLCVFNVLFVNFFYGVDIFIYWYGIILLVNMDGVLGLSFDGIGCGEIYYYWFILY